MHSKQTSQIEADNNGIYTISWVRELTAGDENNQGKVQILARNGKVSRSRGERRGSQGSKFNRLRSWIKATTEGDEHVLMVRDTSRSLDEGIYSCQVPNLNFIR